MTTSVSLARSQLKWPAWVMLFLWLAYAIVYTLPFNNNLEAILEALAGSLGVAVLISLVFPRQFASHHSATMRR